MAPTVGCTLPDGLEGGRESRRSVGEGGEGGGTTADLDVGIS